MYKVLKKIMWKRRKEKIIKDTFWYITEIAHTIPPSIIFKPQTGTSLSWAIQRNVKNLLVCTHNCRHSSQQGQNWSLFLLWGVICNQCTATPPWAISYLPRPWTKVITEQRWATSIAINKAESSLKDTQGRNSVLTTTAVNPWLGVTWVEPLGSDIEVRNQLEALKREGVIWPDSAVNKDPNTAQVGCHLPL